MELKGVIAKYRHFLPVTDRTPIITLGEGGTPGSGAGRKALGCRVNIYLQYEGINLTGCFKDRG